MESARARNISPGPLAATAQASPKHVPIHESSNLSTSSQSTPRSAIPPQTRFQLPFPSIFEQLFAPFDDAIVALCQRRTSGIVLLFSTTFTFFTSIEVSLIAPPTLYALGYDRAAGLCASVLLVLGIVSQVPKKFVFRPRPWMVHRAIPIRQDKTSSFPSRAVVCAVVFSWLIAASLALEEVISAPLPAYLLWPVIICIAVLTAFARINVGAHYPSDTMLGFLLGCVVVKIGNKLEHFWRSVCDPGASYYSEPFQYAVSRTPSVFSIVMNLVTARPFLLVTIVSYAMTLVSIQGFWVKCSYVYGLIMSSMAFRATFLCVPQPRRFASLAHSGIFRVLAHGSLSQHVQAAIPFAMLLIVGMLFRGKKGSIRIVTFSLIYLGSLLFMLRRRLEPLAASTVATVGER